VWMNAAMIEFLGLPSAEIAIGRFNVLTDPFSAETGIKPLYERAYRGELVRSEEFMVEMERASATYGTRARSVWFRMVLCPWLGADGHVRGVMAIMFETTWQRHMAQTLQLAQRRDGLEVLAGGVAHDFNNLLTAIMGNASLLEGGFYEPPEVPELASAILKAGEQAVFLTRQLHAYAGTREGSLRPTDAAHLVGDIVKLLGVTMGPSVELRVENEPAPLIVLADQGQLTQVLMNLVTNAHDAIGEGPGTIVVAARSVGLAGDEVGLHIREPLMAGPYVCIEVRDSGRGMDEATLGRVFEPYYSTKGPGRGLGLAAALGIVWRHGGGIQLESELGRGTCVRMLLPTSTALAPSPIATQQAPVRRRGMVVVADDAAYVRSVVGHSLAQLGFTVEEAENGQQVVDRVRADGHALSLVVLDVMMPVLNGLDALARIRATHPELPVVLMTAHGETGRSIAERDPSTTFLAKPFTLFGLLAVVESIFGR
jgi:two-component system, cell cycle sensor histidine kinase and response regulator CckA